MTKPRAEPMHFHIEAAVRLNQNPSFANVEASRWPDCDTANLRKREARSNSGRIEKGVTKGSTEAHAVCDCLNAD